MKAYKDIPSWVICPQCLNAMEGQIGEPCAVCKTPLQATPLSKHITAKVMGAKPLLAELGEEYDDEEKEVLNELGL